MMLDLPRLKSATEWCGRPDDGGVDWQCRKMLAEIIQRNALRFMQELAARIADEVSCDASDEEGYRIRMVDLDMLVRGDLEGALSALKKETDE